MRIVPHQTTVNLVKTTNRILLVRKLQFSPPPTTDLRQMCSTSLLSVATALAAALSFLLSVIMCSWCYESTFSTCKSRYHHSCVACSGSLRFLCRRTGLYLFKRNGVPSRPQRVELHVSRGRNGHTAVQGVNTDQRGGLLVKNRTVFVSLIPLIGDLQYILRL